MRLLPLLGVISMATAQFQWNLYTVNKRVVKERLRPTWEDLDKRRLPRWYDQAKIGILVHWGIYSIPAYTPPSAPESKMFWKNWMEGNADIVHYMNAAFGRNVTYQQLATNFTAERFDAYEWIDMFKAAGAKYLIITAKDSDGFTLFPSKYAPGWNSDEIGPKRDLVGALKKAANEEGLAFGIYYSMLEWFNTFYLIDKKNGTRDYILEKVRPELEQLVLNYEPKILWSDNGNDSIFDEKYVNTMNFLTWLYNDSPVRDDVVVNDRWNKDTFQKHGDFFTNSLEVNGQKKSQKKLTKLKKRKEVHRFTKSAKLQIHKWEHQVRLDKQSFGYRKISNGVFDILKTKELIEEIVTAVSCGGNVLIHLGAKHDGTIDRGFRRILKELGQWLKLNGEAIYGTSPWRRQNESDGNVWYTCKTDKYDSLHPIAVPHQPDIHATYAIFFEWPKAGILKLEGVVKLLRSNQYKIDLLDRKGATGLQWIIYENKAIIALPNGTSGDFAWTLKFTKIKQEKETDRLEYLDYS